MARHHGWKRGGWSQGKPGPDARPQAAPDAPDAPADDEDEDDNT